MPAIPLPAMPLSAKPSSAMPLPSPAVHSSGSGARLVSTDGRPLPYRGAQLAVDAMAGLARVTLRQVFENPYDEPLRLTYQLPLPPDAAVAGFAFELGDRRIVGEVDGRSAARERFEEALVQGHSAALLEEDRSTLFTQELGNVPPHSRIVCEVQLDQRLAWRDQGEWEWRFPTVVAPRYLGADGRVPDAAAVTVDVDPGGTSTRASLALAVRDACTGPATSPSHRLQPSSGPLGLQLALADEGGAALDRDIVVRWPVAAPTPGVALDRARPPESRPHADRAYGLLTVVPPADAAGHRAVRRDLVVLLDTSGSMGGSPLAQAQAVTTRLVESLHDDDTLQLIEFSTRPRAWRTGPVAATAAVRAEAVRWVQALHAGGGTEMRDGILAALACLRDEAQRQVVLITDGLIGFEREIVEAIATRLPRGSRVHALGIGSGVNRTLTGGVARAGGGVEAIVGIGEDPADAAATLLARTAAPLVVDLDLSGSALADVAHHRLPDLYAGSPARIALRLHPQGGTLLLRGHTAQGAWQQQLQVPPTTPGSGSPAVVTLVGRELVEELDLQAALGQQVDARIERIGLDFQIATRCTSWVAVSPEATVDATAPGRRETIPQALPHGMGVEGLGLRAAMPSWGAGAGMMAHESASVPAPMRKQAAPSGTLFERTRTHARRLFASEPPTVSAAPGAPPAPPTDDASPIQREEAAPAPRSTSKVARRAHVLKGARIVLHKDGRLVIEVDLPLDLDWQPTDRAELELADGTTLLADVDTSRTTRAGQVAAGTTMRLVLAVDTLPARVLVISVADLLIRME